MSSRFVFPAQREGRGTPVPARKSNRPLCSPGVEVMLKAKRLRAWKPADVRESSMELTVKRIYEPAKDSDGQRILVDRLWPRGVSKDRAHLDLWLKEVAPSNDLRKWFGHDPAKWEQFTRKYDAELDANPEAVQELKDAIASHPKTTLLYGAKDEEHNQAVALATYLRAAQ